MARIRTIKPEFWDHEQLGECSSRARLLFAALISDADDEGRGRGSVAHLKSKAFKYEKGVDEAEVQRTMDELSEVEDSQGKLVIFYEACGASFYYLPGFNRQQKIDRPSKSKLPPPSSNPRRRIDESSTKTRRRIKDQGSGIKDQGSSSCSEPPKTEASEQSVPPELADLELYRADPKLCAAFPSLLKVWTNAYQGVDVLSEVRKAHAWEIANKDRRKVNRSKFLNNWLSRAQDKPKSAPFGTSGRPDAICSPEDVLNDFARKGRMEG